MSWRTALDALDEGVSIFDRELKLRAWNRRFVELLGLPAALVEAGVPFATLVRALAERGEFGPGPLDEIVARRVRAAERGGRSYSERTSCDGRVLAAKTTPLAEGGFVTIYTDISERGQAESLTREREGELEARVNQRTLELRDATQELRASLRRLEEASAARAKSEAQLRLICDAIPAAIAYLDDARRFRFANRRFAEMFGRASAEVIDRSVREVVGEDLL